MNSRFLGYVVSSLFAFLFSVAWIFCELSLSGRGAHEQFVGTLGVLIWFALFGGFGVVFLALILPWAVAVSARPKARWSGRLYFTFVGAILVFVLGCLISSLMPKPLFIEDQTFFEGSHHRCKTTRHLLCVGWERIWGFVLVCIGALCLCKQNARFVVFRLSLVRNRNYTH